MTGSPSRSSPTARRRPGPGPRGGDRRLAVDGAARAAGEPVAGAARGPAAPRRVRLRLRRGRDDRRQGRGQRAPARGARATTRRGPPTAVHARLREQQSELARRFFTAARTGDLAGLESLLAHDVELVGDGGGKAPSLARSQRGRSRVAHTLTNWLRALRRLPEMEIRLTEVNGDPGAMFLVEGRLLAVWALDVRDGQVAGVRAVVNPTSSSTSGRSGRQRPRPSTRRRSSRQLSVQLRRSATAHEAAALTAATVRTDGQAPIFLASTCDAPNPPR